MSIAVDQWVGSQADPASTVVSSGALIPFLVIAAVGLVPLVVILRVNRTSERVVVTSLR